MSQKSFADLGVAEPITAALARRSIHTPFSIQELVLPDAISGLDVLAKSPTGSGKTLAFAVPIVQRLDPRNSRPSALVLVPTRELASQVAEEFADVGRARGLEVAAVYGGTSIAAQARAAKSAHILVATPGRLEDLARRRLVKLDDIRILVLDEADRMLDMGFQPQVDAIVRRLPRNRQTMFFSATLDGEVAKLARAYTDSPSRFDAQLPSHLERGETEHRFVGVTADTKVETLVEMLGHDDGLTLVFVRTKRGADRLVQKLTRHDVKAVALHGDMNQRARERALERFDSGKVSTLVATDVAARGLDLDHITHVINFDPPADKKGYVHRVGRTARAGRDGTGITLVLPEQQAEVSHFARSVGEHGQFEQQGMRVAPKRLVYSGRGRRSRWGAPPRSRKI
ncbi:MAG TPA: DEAD/DEAH box helicase [Gaiellaceae bacterium]|nr:DEAD/DEAH box helicase [Gaiellaceae bacterium]